MLKRVITLRVPVALLYAFGVIVILAVLLGMTNALPNLRFALLPDQVESIVVFHTSLDAQAVLTPEDTRELAEAMSKVVLVGKSVRVMMEDDYGPQFRVQLKNGDSFTFSCWSDHYVLNGRGYDAGATDLIYRDIYTRYQSCNNRSYFPEEGRG